MTRVTRLLAREDGFAMMWVVLLTSVLVVLSVTMIDIVRAESSQTADARLRGAVFHAAEAGLDDYLAKLVDDKTYYYRNVHPAESTRRPTSGADVDPLTTACRVDTDGAKINPATSTPIPATSWTGSTTWTSPNGKDNWCQLVIGNRTYEYNLQITPPSTTNLNIRIVATGRPLGSTNRAEWRAIEEWVRYDQVSDFQMITSQDYDIGSSSATIDSFGKIYAGRDVNHSGRAYADIFAERYVNGPDILVPPAQTYDQTDIRTVIKNPIDFNVFTGSLDDIERASVAAGTYLDATPAVWKIVFSANGTYTTQSCSLTGGNNPGQTAPTCGAASSPKTVPPNGAIFSEKTVVVSGVVDGRVTIASQFDIVVGGSLSYETPVGSPGDDVLGLIGKNDIIVAAYVPSTFTWRAAVIAQNGARHSWNCYGGTSGCGSHTVANHYGSTASKDSPGMSQFDDRNYYYDDTLQYLPPPWFPVLDEAYTVALFREVRP